ncbi:MAG TPA: glycosyltransferase [Gammaproteobacteria bacterium]
MRRRRLVAFGFRELRGVEGGIETHARELYSRLAPLGYEITVLVRCGYRPACSGDDVPGLESKRVWAPRGKGVESFVHSFLCAGYCIAARPELVHVHGIGPAVFAPLLRLAGLRVVVTHHGRDYDAAKWGRFARALLRIGERAGVRHADAVICVSDSIRRAVEASAGVRCHAIYNGAASGSGPYVRPTGRLGRLEPGSYVLMVGRITEHKRILDVAAAMEAPALASRRLVVCGNTETDDPYAKRVRAAAARNRRIVLAGYVAPRELPWLYRHSACTVMASTYEGMPLAVLEALACGARVLLSDIDAHEELGLPRAHYFERGNVADLALRLERLLAAPRTDSGKLDERFDWSNIALQTAAVLDRVVQRPEQAAERSR